MGFQQERKFVRLLICLYSLPWNHLCAAPDVGWYQHCSANQPPPSSFLSLPLWRQHWSCEPTNTQKKWPPQWFQKPQLLQTPSRRSSASVLSSLPHLPLPLWFSEISLYQMQRHPLITFDTLITGAISARFINLVNSGQQRRSAIVLLINFEILGT